MSKEHRSYFIVGSVRAERGKRQAIEAHLALRGARARVSDKGEGFFPIFFSG